MRMVATILVGLVMLIVAAGAGLYFVVPTETITAEVVRQVKERTGRNLTITGQPAFRFYPDIAVELSGVALSNPPGQAGPGFAEVGRVVLALELFPLLQREIAVKRLVLENPVVRLTQGKDGKRNWDFAHLAAPTKRHAENDWRWRWSPSARDRLAVIGTAHAQSGGLTNLRVRDFQVRKGQVFFTDEKTGTREEVSALDLDLAMADLTQPLDAKGAADYRGQRVRFTGQLERPVIFTHDREGRSPVTVSLATAGMDAGFQGAVSLTKGGQADGALSLQGPDVAGLLMFARIDPSDWPAPLRGAYAITSTVTATATRADFVRLSASAGSLAMQGDLRVAWNRARPLITGQLSIPKMDIAQFASLPDGAMPAGWPLASPVRRAAGELQPMGGGLFHLAQAQAPQAAAKRAPVRGWSTTPFNLASLSAADADLKLSFAELRFGALAIADARLDTALDNRALNITLTEAAAYGGRVTGEAILDARTRQPAYLITLDLDRMSALPFLKDAADFDWLSGRLGSSAQIAGLFGSQAQAVSSARGTLNLRFEDGAIEGINIPKFLRGLQSGQIGDLSRVPDAKTDFSLLSGSFAITDGLADTRDVHMIGPLLRMTAQGTIDLPARTLDVRTEPKLVASLEGQGATGDVVPGLTIPLLVQGPWEKPKITPDLSAIAKDPQSVLEAGKQIEKRVRELTKDKKPEQILKDLLGGGKSPF